MKKIVLFIFVFFVSHNFLIVAQKVVCPEHPVFEKFDFKKLKYRYDLEKDIILKDEKDHYQKLQDLYEDFVEFYTNFEYDYSEYSKKRKKFKKSKKYLCFSGAILNIIPSVPQPFLTTSYFLDIIPSIFDQTDKSDQKFVNFYLKYIDFLLRFSQYKKDLYLHYLKSLKSGDFS